MELEREMKNCPGGRIGDEEEEGVKGEEGRGRWGARDSGWICDI